MDKKTKLAISIAFVLFVTTYAVIFVLPLYNEQREECKRATLYEEDVHAEVFVIGNGSEKGLIKVRVMVNNSENKLTNVSISRVYDEYAKNSLGIEQHFAGNISDFSEMRIDQDTNLFWTEFEVSKNKKYIIKLQIQNKWDSLDVRIPLNTW